MAEIRHEFVDTNGIRMHVAEAGEGFPVVMCHGWPELWYSWRHQIPFLAANGFRAIAPDMRGYGETDAPADSEGYRSASICADIAGMLDALEIEKAVIVGHDWGGYHIWQFALRYPERTAALIGLNTPYSGPPSPLPSTQLLHTAFGEGDRGYYMLYFQKPGQAEAELGSDIRTNLAKVFHPYTRAQDLWTFATVGGDGSGVFTRIAEPETFLTPDELDYYTAAFTNSGFTGGLNYYRAMDRNWADLKAIGNYEINVPTLMITAENDLILRPAQAEPMRQWIPNLRIELVRNCSHWTQQERPDEVNALMLDFLSGLDLAT
ncbi:MAG: alpha/beta fold hydrolase [Dehalococcoidia bacterium]